MLEAVTSALSTILGWVGTVISSLVTTGTDAGELSPLLPLFAVGIAISVILLGIRVIKSVIWGA